MANSQSHFRSHRDRHRIRGMQDPSLELGLAELQGFETGGEIRRDHGYENQFSPRLVSEAEVLTGSVEAAERYLSGAQDSTQSADQQPGL